MTSWPANLALFSPVSKQTLAMAFVSAVPVERETQVTRERKFNWATSSAVSEALAFTGFRLKSLKQSGRPYRGRAGIVCVKVDGSEIAKAEIADCDPYEGCDFSLTEILFRAFLPASGEFPAPRMGVFLPNGSVVSFDFTSMPQEVKKVRLHLDTAIYKKLDA